MTNKKRGQLLVFEGIDGAGKSSLARLLTEFLHTQGYVTCLTKEPGDNSIGSSVRAIVQESGKQISSQAEFLLFAADRAQHIKEVVLPALERGEVVVSDRLSDSSLAYQGYGRGLDKKMIMAINNWVMGDLRPDLTIFVSVPLECAFERIAKRNEQRTRFEEEQESFMQRVSDGFEEIYAGRDDVLHLNGTDALIDIATHMNKCIRNWLEK